MSIELEKKIEEKALKEKELKEEQPGLLAGIKVLDLSRILAGPWATQLLADYGATVWKIEKPGVGDDTRHWGPPFLSSEKNNVSAYFLTANRGKKSLSIDISQPEGQKLIQLLVKEADILVENFKVGGLKQFDLDYTTLSKINPQLIYCSITGFGQTGPMADAPGYDAMIQAMGGLMSINGHSSEAQGEPLKVGVAVTDLMTGMYATTAILAALNYRNISGKGQHIDLALLDTQVAMLANQGMNYLITGNNPKRYGNGHPNIVPYQTFQCADGHIMLAVGNDQQFSALCKQLEITDLSQDEQFNINANRVKNRDLLIPILETIFQQSNVNDWVQKLTTVNIPCSAVNSIEQCFAEPQVKHRQMQFTMTSEHFDEIPQIDNPVKFSEMKVKRYISPPALGENTTEILQEVLMKSEDELRELKRNKVI